VQRQAAQGRFDFPGTDARFVAIVRHYGRGSLLVASALRCPRLARQEKRNTKCSIWWADEPRRPENQALGSDQSQANLRRHG
jgi:hypothetical protein